MLDYGAQARLLIAYIDDERAVDDKEAARDFESSRHLIFAKRRKRPGTHHQYDGNRTGKVRF
jgi:hypothetical protein